MTISSLLLKLLTLAIFLGISSASFGRALSDTSTHIASEDIHFLEDHHSALTINDALKPEQHWLRLEQDNFNKGYNDSSWWLRVELENDSSERVDRLFQIAYAALDHVELYLLRDGQIVETWHVGDELPYHARPVRTTDYVFPLHWDPSEKLTVFIRVKTTSSVQIPLRLWSNDSFNLDQININFMQGLYYGAMLIIAIYNLLLFMALRDRSYFYYVCFIVSIPLFWASATGQAYRFLWPDLVTWNQISVSLFLTCSNMFAGLFTRNFLELQKISFALDRLILSLIMIDIVMLGVSIFLPYKVSIAIMLPLSILHIVVYMMAGTYAWKQKMETARYYVLAWALFLIGAVILNLNKNNLLPNTPLTEYALQIGSAVEAVLLSFALAERINREKRLRFQAQEEILSTHKRLNEELEDRVTQRTEELANLTVKLQELSDTDALTTLFNRRYLESVGSSEYKRCQRARQQFAVLMIDIDHFKAINDAYGHDAGDACLQQVSSVIRECAKRPGDIAARFGGEEFCVVLPNTDEDGALSVAEKIRRQVEQVRIFTSDDRQFSVTVSSGIEANVPEPQQDLRHVIKKADTALYQSKKNGRNRVTVYRNDA